MKLNSHDLSQRSQLVGLYRKALAAGMSLPEIEKKIERRIARIRVSQAFEQADDHQDEVAKKRSVPKAIVWGSILVPLVFIGIGLYLVGSAVVPILGYYVITSPELSRNNLIAPIPQQDIVEVTPIFITQAGATDPENTVSTQPLIIDEELDYTNLVNWFDQDLPELSGEMADGQSAVEYSIDIPKLKIENAKVAIGGTDLNKSLIAYPGTSLPGELGSPVIFGHSVLRQFYNPSEKNPRRYNSIFSTIMTLEPGDPIYVTLNDVKYTYVVQTKSEVKPADVHILNQQYDSRKLKLVTCTPEGTYLRRGVITAQLVSES